jgi:hypothetical protein
MKTIVTGSLAKALMLAGALLTINMAPMTARADTGGTPCSVIVPPGGSCTVTTSCFMGYCKCIVVCCCG